MTPPGAEDIYTRHQPDVYRYARRMTGRPDVADDVCQDVFLRIVRALQNGSTVGHERGWVFAIVRSAVADHWRRGPHRMATEEMAIEPAADAPQTLAYGLDEALARLADADRDAFLLKEIGGLTYLEIAAVCSCTVESVRSRLFRTRMQLRTALEGLR
jgi:RNA polymerase sigma-70 factor, ECF subfamily